jgi:hypothetical protein
MTTVSTIAPIFWGLAAARLAMPSPWVFRRCDVDRKRSRPGVFHDPSVEPAFLDSPAIGVVEALIYKWVQSCRGNQVAWLIACNAILTAWDWVKIAL